jgi:ribonuclease E
VLRRLVECLGRDRTRHQVAEVTSLGLVQMTRKRIGTGLLEAFSENCEHCAGRGVIVSEAPVEQRRGDDEPRRGGTRRARGGRSRGEAAPAAPSPMDVAAVARPEVAVTDPDEDELDTVAADLEPLDIDELDQTEPEQTELEQTEPEGGAPENVEPAAAPESVEDSAPRVVTRTRRRAASRPAGPPQVSDESTAAPVAEDSSAVVDGDSPHVEHVPIKKKGARKR